MDYQDWLYKGVLVVVILIVGYLISKVLESIVAGVLKRMGLDRKLEELPKTNMIYKITKSPSAAVGAAVYWLGIIVTITVAISALNAPVFNEFLSSVYGYIPNILAAIIILAVALALSIAVTGIVNRLMGDTTTGRIISVVVPAIILAIASFAILEELLIAPNIVAITYATLMGSLGLGFALAFGLGGREIAGRLLERGYKAGLDNADQIKRDIERGKNRANQEKKKYEQEL